MHASHIDNHIFHLISSLDFSPVASFVRSLPFEWQQQWNRMRWMWVCVSVCGDSFYHAGCNSLDLYAATASFLLRYIYLYPIWEMRKGICIPGCDARFYCHAKYTQLLLLQLFNVQCMGVCVCVFFLNFVCLNRVYISHKCAIACIFRF